MSSISLNILRTLRAGVVVLIVVTSLLFGCSSDDNDITVTPAVETPSVTSSEILDALSNATYEQKNCGELIPAPLMDDNVLGDTSVECGFVSVPADWTQPDGKRLKLAVYKIPTTSNNPAPDPLVYLDGGPGGAGVSLVGEFANGSLGYLRERSDVYSIDQRGTGYSQPALYCREVFQAEEDGSAVAALVAAYKACHDRMIGEGVNFGNYNSRNNALDIAAIRLALGIDNWNLYGVSYGSRLALTVMREAPQGVRSVVLDSVFPLEINGISEADYPNYFAIDQIASNCAADDDCSANIGDLKPLIESAIARLDANPVGGLVAQRFIQFLSESIADPETASIIRVIAEGTELEITTLLSKFNDQKDEKEKKKITPADAPENFYPFVTGIAKAMMFSVGCAEEMPYLNHKAGPVVASTFTETTQRVINDVLNDDIAFFHEICNIFNVPEGGEIETRAVISNIPALILAATADVATPPAWSMLAHDSLLNSQYAEFDGLGHGLIGLNSCINDITSDFLSDIHAPADQSCIADLPEVDYQTE